MHNLFIGMSFSGKTNLAKRFAHDAKSRGENVYIFDPLSSVGWPDGVPKYSSPAKFLEFIKTAENGHVFIDEAKVLFEHDLTAANRVLFQRRHQGLLCYVIAQRTKMIPPNARDQCSRVFAFNQKAEDSKMLSQETHPDMLALQKFKKGDFIYSDGFEAQHLTLDYSNGLPPTIKTLTGGEK